MFGLLSQARGEDSSGANFVHLYRGRRSISFRRWCFSSRRRFLFRLYLISSERRRLRRLLKWRSSSSSPLSSSLASISGGRERAPRLFFRFQKPRRSPRPIRSSNSNSTTNYCLSLDRIHIYTPSFRFFRSGEEGAAVGRGIRGENGIRASIPRGTRAGVPGPFCRALLMSRPIDRDALIDNRMSVNRSSGSRVDVSRLFPNGKSIG